MCTYIRCLICIDQIRTDKCLIAPLKRFIEKECQVRLKKGDQVQFLTFNFFLSNVRNSHVIKIFILFLFFFLNKKRVDWLDLYMTL